jgi:peptidylprolyl isomerase
MQSIVTFIRDLHFTSGEQFMKFGIKHMPIFGLMIITIFISGCMGYQVGGNSEVPATMPTSNPSAQTIDVTSLPTSGNTEQVISVTPTPVPARASASPSAGNTAKSGDNVSVDYTGWNENGSIFDTTIAETAKQAGIYDSRKAYVPTSFVVGTGSVISGFDDAVIGMSVGETRNITLEPEEAYGQYNTSLIQPVPMNILVNAGITPHVGQTIYCNHQPVKVLEITKDNTVMVDFNSPYAGKTLQFNITQLNIQAANT